MNIATIKEVLIEIQKINEFESSFKARMPFRFNVIDELHANENAHSRIVARLLEYEESGSYPFLMSFLEQIGINELVKSPVISMEKNRIDILIRDDNYAIIIENKVHNAVDQKKQIKRYVEVVNEEYKLEQIYVIYLTRDGSKEVAESSLPLELRNKLGARFLECNFKYNILTWLQDEVLPFCRHNDTILISGIQQYIDHLNGIFLIREDLQDMNKKIKEYLNDEFKLSSNIKENAITLDEKINNVENYSNALRALRADITSSLREDFIKKLYAKLNSTDEEWICVTSVHKEVDINHFDENNFGFKLKSKTFNCRDKELFVSIEIQSKSKFLCGVFLDNDSQIQELLKTEFESLSVPINDNAWWVTLMLDEYEIDGQKIANGFYNPNWDSLYIENMNGIVELFYEQIRSFINAFNTVGEKLNKK